MLRIECFHRDSLLYGQGNLNREQGIVLTEQELLLKRQGSRLLSF